MIQTRLLYAETFLAMRTLVRPYTCVNSFMYFAVTFVSKSSSTITLVWLFTCVNPLLNSTSITLTEGFITMLALKRLFSCMNPLMLPLATSYSERFFTILTLERSFTRVNHLVRHTETTMTEGFITILTLEGLFTCGIPFMDNKIMFVTIFFSQCQHL